MGEPSGISGRLDRLSAPAPTRDALEHQLLERVEILATERIHPAQRRDGHFVVTACGKPPVLQHKVDDLPPADEPAPRLRAAGVAMQLVDEPAQVFKRSPLVVSEGVRVAEVEIAEISPVCIVHTSAHARVRQAVWSRLPKREEGAPGTRGRLSGYHPVMAKSDTQDALMERLARALESRGIPVHMVLEAILEASTPTDAETRTARD